VSGSVGRVGLILPPSSFLASEKIFISLGILKIGACLKKAGHSVSLLDLNGVSNYEDVVRKFCQETDARTFGISVVTPQFPYTRKIVNVIREVLPEAKIIGGGPHITSSCAAYKREKKLGIVGRAHRSYRQIMETFDVSCAGDGEESVLLAIQPGARGLIDGDDPSSPLFLQSPNLDDYPYPDRSLIDIGSYQYRIDGRLSGSYLSQLGCPYPCTFCNGRLSPSFRRVRTRTALHLKEEIRHLYNQYGFLAYMDYSDEMNIYPTLKEDLRHLIDLQDEVGERFKFRGFIKANLFTREQAKLFAEAGFVELCVGGESGSDRILRNIQKKSTRKDNLKTVLYCHEVGIRCKMFCSLGHAGESEETIEETRDFLIEAKPDDLDVSTIVCFGGTEYHDFAVPHPDMKGVYVYEARETKDRLYQYDVDFGSDVSFYKGKPGEYRAQVFTDFLTAEQLTKYRDQMETEVRSALKIPFYPITPAKKYDKSMGILDPSILRHSG